MTHVTYDSTRLHYIQYCPCNVMASQKLLGKPESQQYLVDLARDGPSSAITFFFNTPTFHQNESIFRPHWTTLTLLLSCPRANKCSDLCSHRLSMAIFFYRIYNLYHFILPFLETVCFCWLCSYANAIYGHPSSASMYSVFSVCCLNTMQHVLYVMYSILYHTVLYTVYCMYTVYGISILLHAVCFVLCASKTMKMSTYRHIVFKPFSAHVLSEVAFQDDP